MGIIFNLDIYNSLPQIINIKNRVKEIVLICEKLSSKDYEGYITKKISNSDESQIEILKYSKYKAKIYRIKPIKLACCQENLGNRLYSEELNMLDEGNYSFTIVKGKETRNITIKVEEEDANYRVLTKILEAVEKENMGIEGSIENYNRYIDRLLIKSKGKGTENSFRVFDKRGSLVEYTGMWNEFIEAEDSIAIVNGEEYKSSSDTFEIDDGEFVFIVKKASKDEVIISITWNIELILKSIFQLIDALNYLLKELKKEVVYKRTLNILIKGLKEIENVVSPAGFFISDDFEIRITESQLKSYLDKNNMDLDKLICKVPHILNGIMEFCTSILQDRTLLIELDVEKPDIKNELDKRYDEKGNLVYKGYNKGKNYDNIS